MGRELGKEVGRRLRKDTKRGESEPRAAMAGRRAFAMNKPAGSVSPSAWGPTKGGSPGPRRGCGVEEEKEKRVEEEQKGQENTEEKTRKGREKEAVVCAHHSKGPQESGGGELRGGLPTGRLRGDSREGVELG